MIEDLKKVLDSFKVDFDDVIQQLVKIGKESYTELLNSEQLPPIHYNHCYFAMASLLLKDVKNVLEIGTGPGRSTKVLAQLFPNANVYTVDVPSDDPYFKQSWLGRDFGQFEKEILINTSLRNIAVLRDNSFFLPSLDMPKKFELIFVDGSHIYPAVAWDIMYAYGAIAPGGFLFMHDYEVITKTDNHVKHVVEYMRSRIRETIWLLPEYADPKWENGRMACLVGHDDK